MKFPCQVTAELLDIAFHSGREAHYGCKLSLKCTENSKGHVRVQNPDESWEVSVEDDSGLSARPGNFPDLPRKRFTFRLGRGFQDDSPQLEVDAYRKLVDGENQPRESIGHCSISLSEELLDFAQLLRGIQAAGTDRLPNTSGYGVRALFYSPKGVSVPTYDGAAWILIRIEDAHDILPDEDHTESVGGDGPTDPTLSSPIDRQVRTPISVEHQAPDQSTPAAEPIPTDVPEPPPGPNPPPTLPPLSAPVQPTRVAPTRIVYKERPRPVMVNVEVQCSLLPTPAPVNLISQQVQVSLPEEEQFLPMLPALRLPKRQLQNSVSTVSLSPAPSSRCENHPPARDHYDHHRRKQCHNCGYLSVLPSDTPFEVEGLPILPTLPLADIADQVDARVLAVIERYNGEIDHYKDAIRKMGTDILSLRQQIAQEQQRNKWLEEELAAQNSNNVYLVREEDLEKLGREDLLRRHLQLMRRYGSLVSHYRDVKDELFQRRNNQIKWNDMKKEHLRVQAAHRDQQTLLHHLQSQVQRGQKYKSLCKQQEKIIQDMEQLIELAARKSGTAHSTIRPETLALFTKENSRLRAQIAQIQDQISAKQEGSPTGVSQSVAALQEQMERERGRAARLTREVEQLKRQQPITSTTENLLLQQKLEHANAKIKAMENMLQSNAAKWGEREAELMLRLTEQAAVAEAKQPSVQHAPFKRAQSRPKAAHRSHVSVIAVVKKDGGHVLQHLNSQHPRIQFTMEQEDNGSLPFMDCRFTRQPQGELMRGVYQKPTHTNRYVQFDSHHPSSIKSGIVRCLAERAIRVSSSEEARDAEFRRISLVMVCNGYPRKFVQKAISRQVKSRAARRVKPQQDQSKAITVRIPFIDGLSQEVRRVARTAGVRCAFYTPNTLGSLYNSKDPLPRGSVTHAVYSVKCKTCDDEYVGETRRAVDVRRKEHSDAIRLGQCSKSAIAEHVHDQQSPHEMDWSSLRVIDRACQQRERRVREAFRIYQRKPQINRDTGVERSAVWNAVL